MTDADIARIYEETFQSWTGSVRPAPPVHPVVTSFARAIYNAAIEEAIAEVHTVSNNQWALEECVNRIESLKLR